MLIDEVRVGTIGIEGTFSRDIAPGEHSLELRKTGFESHKETHNFKAGDSFHVNAELRPLGNLSLRLSPAMMRITVQREGESVSSTLPNNQSPQLRAGAYVVSAEAEGYSGRSETVQIEPGKTTPVDWQLKPAQDTPIKPVVPKMLTFFENGDKWTPEGGPPWWVHQGSGYSFLRNATGGYMFDVLPEKKGIFRGAKKIRFMDFAGEGNYIQYTLDGHSLEVKVFSDGEESGGQKVPHGMDGQSSFRIIVEMTADTITIKNRSGKVLSNEKKKSATSKFGISDGTQMTMPSKL